MYRVVPLFLVFGFSLAIIPSKAAARSVDSSQNEPMPDTPLKLMEVWLRFHEADLCQGIEAEFVFNKDGMQVLSRVEDERSYQKFMDMLEPLRRSYRIELYATRPPSEKNSEDDKALPPSLWENYELRANLGDPIARGFTRETAEIRLFDRPDETLKQLLMMYSEQTLDRNRKMKRYAADLLPLARMAFGHTVSPDIRMLAKRVCLAHAQNLNKFIGKLNANLRQALPKASKKSGASSGSDNPAIAAKVPVDLAVQISEDAHIIAQHVHNFIRPENYTVGLEELRNPSLLESLAELQKLNEDFQRAMDGHASK
jgi:hypothetical protein